jgi:hypothetical protein
LALRISPKDPFAYFWHLHLCQAHLHLHEYKDAKTLAEVNKIHPNFTLQAYRQIAYAFSSNPQYRHEIDDIVEGLRKGGIPEQ